jgi:hypothetical protein
MCPEVKYFSNTDAEVHVTNGMSGSVMVISVIRLKTSTQLQWTKVYIHLFYFVHDKLMLLLYQGNLSFSALNKRTI